MHFSTTVASLAVVGIAAARNCQNVTVPVTVSVQQPKLDYPTPQDDYDITAFAVMATRQGLPASPINLQTVSGSYSISATFCSPDKPSTSKPVVQILTHGAGYDKTYWDASYNNYNYSYVNSALDAGYYVLNYDRLGVGNSSHGDPVNEIQLNLEVAGLCAMTTLLREGTFPGSNNIAFGKNIVHIGHSFGSAQTYTFSGLYPNETAAIVLTGYSANQSWTGDFIAGGAYQQANTNQPLRFGNVTAALLQKYYSIAENFLAESPIYDLLAGLRPENIADLLPVSGNYPNGYITTGNIQSLFYSFFSPGNFDFGLLQYHEDHKTPTAIGEFLSFAPPFIKSNFSGPVLVFTGNNDVPFCGGNCYATGDPKVSSVLESTKGLFSNPGKFETYVQPNAGHGLTGHYNATAGYKVIQQWIKENVVVS